MNKVLIIEDNNTLREQTAEILKLANYDVITASNGRDGSFLSKTKNPDLILCDVMMPELDGYGVLQILSSSPKTASIPFIFITAKAQMEDIRKGMGLGADDYLCKPFTGTELLTAIEVRLKKYENHKHSKEKDDEEDFVDYKANLNDLLYMYKDHSVSRYKKHEVIFHEGDTPQYVYFVKSGSVKGYKTHNDGKEFITNMYVTNDFFGHAAVLNNDVNFDSAVVNQDSEIVKIPKDEFLKLLSSNKQVTANFLKILSGAVRGQEVQLMSLAYDTVRKRAAEALLLLVNKSSHRGKHENEIIVSRDDLACLVGTATETVIRCLSEFKEDGLITVKGRQITIKDMKGLQQV